MIGNIIDTFKYDTYGRMTEHTGDGFIIFGYNGRDGVVTDKNGLIYMRARYYSPEMRRFVNADIVPGEISNAITLNRYAYANGNPVSNVDPFGLSAERGQGPTPLEAAYMAQHIYDAVRKRNDQVLDKKYGGWILSEIFSNKQGLKIGVYYRISNGTTSYAIVNAGSEANLSENFSGTWNDWVNNNLTQPFGGSLDMKDSIQFAKNFVSKNSDADITFIGHSKGGAEAIANAVATNKNAIVFNPATANLEAYSLPIDEYTSDITSYVVEGEFLDTLSVVLGKNIGTEITLESPYNYDVNLPEWNSQLLGAQEPTAQLGQFIGNSIFNFVNSNIKKHSIDLVIELLGG